MKPSQIVIVAICLAACSQATPTVPPASATPGLLAIPPAVQVTLTGTSDASAATPVIIASATPTATPVTHVVTEGETLLGIAIDYGVSVEALQAVNPEVQVRFLAIGTVLLIPPPEGGAAISATHLAPPPPAALTLSDPACFGLASGALYCFVEARNSLDGPVENVSVRVVLAGSDGLPLASGIGYSAVEVIPPGSSAPVWLAFQHSPASPIAAMAAELLSADAAGTSVSQGLVLPLEMTEQIGASDGDHLTVTGTVANVTETTAAAAWIVATVYDADGTIIGFRRHALTGPIAPGASAGFSLTVDALAGRIDHYALLAEGRP